MLTNTLTRRRIGAIAAALLLTVSLPATTAWAKTKTKTPAAEQSETAPATDTSGTSMTSDFSVDVPAIESIDSNVDDAVIRDIFTGKLAENADALAGLTATSITIPTITIDASSTMDGDTMEAEVTVSDVVFSDVEDGVAGSVTVGGFTIDSDEGSAELGEWSASNLDIGGMIAIYGLVAHDASTEPQTIYTDFSFAGGTITSDKASCTIGEMTAAEFKARPLKYSFAEIMALAEASDTQNGDPSPEVVGKALRMYVDIFTAFETSPIEFGGFECSGTDDNDKPIDFSIAGMSVGGMSPGSYPQIEMNGIDIKAEGDSAVSLGNVTFKAMDLSGPIAAVQNAPEAIDAQWLADNARRLIPAFAGFSFSDLSVDVPDTSTPGQRVVASVGDFDLTLDDYVNGIPASLDTSANNIVFDVPANTQDPQMQQLLALGITSIDAGFAIDAAWDEAANTINVNQITLNGADLGTVMLAGTIANATQSLFALDENEALAAAMGVAIADLRVDVKDQGLGDIVLKSVAEQQGSTPETLRTVFAGLAEGTIVSMLAGAADAQKVGGAVNAFISGKAKDLSIAITAKEAPGLGLADFNAAEQDPTVLIGKVNIDASAK